MAPARRRRIGAAGMILRRRRIFARLREGRSYEDIAHEEGVTSERIRQVVSDVLQHRAVDSGADHAKLQLDRLAPVMQLAAEAVAPGDITAIGLYLKVLDKLDCCQTVAGASQSYHDGARKRLFDTISRVAANLGVDRRSGCDRRGWRSKGEPGARRRKKFNLNPPQVLEKSRFGKIKASKCKRFYLH
jgi:hypothetical protein